jgi:DNA mismatch repair protein MutS
VSGSHLETVEKERTGIKTLRLDTTKFRILPEISRANAVNAPPEYIRKQTLVNAERFITPEMKEYEALVLNAEETIHDIETDLPAGMRVAASSSKRISERRKHWLS